MKKLIFISLILFQTFASFSQEEIKKVVSKDSILTLDEFINAFYQAQDNPEELIPFFDEIYYKSLYEFIGHMELKNKRWREFKEKKLKSKKINFDGTIISLRYKVKYKKYTANDKLLIKRDKTTNNYRIYYWRTR